MSFSLHASAALLLGTIVALPSQGMAVPVQDAHSEVFLWLTPYGGPTETTQETGSTSMGLSGTNGGASATGTTSSQPFPVVSASATVAGGGQAIVHARMVYYFEVLGPNGVNVPLVIAASGGVSQPSSEVPLNTAWLFFYNPLIGGGSLLGLACLDAINTSTNCLAHGGEAASFSIAAPVSVATNTQYALQMDVDVIAQSLSGGNDSAFGFVDPIISFDPNFSSTGFQLVLSDNVGNGTSVVPVPGALPLFATGFGVLGFIAHRRKRKAA